jgi:hypothetical protein
MEEIFQCYRSQKKTIGNTHLRLETLLNSLTKSAKPKFILNLDRILRDELPTNYINNNFKDWKTWQDWTALSTLLSTSINNLEGSEEEKVDEQDSADPSFQVTNLQIPRSFSGLLFEFYVLLFLVYDYNSYSHSGPSFFLENAQISKYIQGNSVEQKLLRKQLKSKRTLGHNQGKILQYKMIMNYLVHRMDLVYSSLSGSPQSRSKLTFSIEKGVFDKVQLTISHEDWDDIQDLLAQIRPLPSVIEALLKKSKAAQTSQIDLHSLTYFPLVLVTFWVLLAH